MCNKRDLSQHERFVIRYAVADDWMIMSKLHGRDSHSRDRDQQDDIESRQTMLFNACSDVISFASIMDPPQCLQSGSMQPPMYCTSFMRPMTELQGGGGARVVLQSHAKTSQLSTPCGATIEPPRYWKSRIGLCIMSSRPADKR